MKFVTLKDSANQEKIPVDGIHYFPETLDEDVLSTGFLTEDIPAPEMIPGKKSLLYYNSVTKDFYYEHPYNKYSKEYITAAIDSILFGDAAAFIESRLVEDDITETMVDTACSRGFLTADQATTLKAIIASKTS